MINLISHTDNEFYNMKPTRLRDARLAALIAQNTAWSKLGLSGLRDLRAYEWGVEMPDDDMYQKMSELYGKSVKYLKGELDV
ncbi:hypothetical protein [Weissella cibaria]|uniref:hypothetical protein n=1 Tax=Weissella cibaria TaxID=137591 RepID=UPI001C1F5CEE|nr:hypothetical protein [Weissella cibaria]MBU7544318.1 hypothetical protein [Weissella cibaria]MCV3317398.1 hypothetical protein [Weissella cibaria]